jgi:tRNA-dihydrouridine synthase
MLKPDLVREIVQSMQRRVSIPVTVKCRIGADNRDSYVELKEFITSARDGGARKFIIHSRKCFLKGLSTKQNRDIPPLKYGVVHRLRQEFPELTFILNGGIANFNNAAEHMVESGYLYRPNPEIEQKPKSGCLDLKWDDTTPIYAFQPTSVFSTSIQTAREAAIAEQENAAASSAYELDIAEEILKTPLASIANDDASINCTVSGMSTTTAAAIEMPTTSTTAAADGFLLPAVHGVMIGRAAFNNPFLFATADSRFYGVPDPCLTRREVAQRYIKYCEWAQSDDGPKKKVGGRKGQPVTTSVLMRPMHNLMIGMKNCGRYKQALNDLYMERIKGINGTPNPSPREIVSKVIVSRVLQDGYMNFIESSCRVYTLRLADVANAMFHPAIVWLSV